MSFLKLLASAAALEELRTAYPDIVGREKFEALYTDLQPIGPFPYSGAQGFFFAPAALVAPNEGRAA